MITVDFLDELDRFNLALKKHSEGLHEGRQKSGDTGTGMIFEDHKKYIPGDDIRRMDWKAYARSNEYYIKRFEEEKSVTLHVLLDRSSSMDYGRFNKYEYGAKLGVGLAYMATNTSDRYRFSVFSETVTDISSARRSLNPRELVDTLNTLDYTPDSRFERCLTQYGDYIKNTSVVVVISDFLSSEGDISRGVERLSDSDMVLVNVLDETEIEPDFEGDTILKDPESGDSLRTYLSGKVKSRYEKKMEEHTGKVAEAAERNGARYLKVSTGDDFFDSFMSLWQEVNR
ncbi:MAG: DUF58 domain-containing protein [Candidatus Nanohaloarchaeota archaeon QJJ-7]|nr:DUF58 domain-containing protein [Candidatus Nanohaloarchaeota archaeon QJJ-7]